VVQKKIKNKSWWRIGCIWGPSGSGKSSISKLYFSSPPEIEWNDNEPVINHFGSDDIFIDEIFSVVELNIIHTLKPYHVLSMGEKFRTRLARILYYAYLQQKNNNYVENDVI